MKYNNKWANDKVNNESVKFIYFWGISLKKMKK